MRKTGQLSAEEKKMSASINAIHYGQALAHFYNENAMKGRVEDLFHVMTKEAYLLGGLLREGYVTLSDDYVTYRVTSKGIQLAVNSALKMNLPTLNRQHVSVRGKQKTAN